MRRNNPPAYTSLSQAKFPTRLYRRKRDLNIVTITFQNRETEKRALGHLLGRFSARVLSTGEHFVPEAALKSLADQGIPFTVKGKATYEQQLAAIRAFRSQNITEKEG